jgi:serine/threonine protein kinase
MPAKLTVIAGPDRGRGFEVADEQKLVVGRGEATGTKLRDPTVSRIHCQVLAESGCYSLENLGAASGTSVNGKRISGPHALRSGDLIRIGDTELRFMIDGPVAAGPSAPIAERPEPLKELVGTTLSHYKILCPIAKGSSGMVFQALDTRESKLVALKILWPEFSKNDEEMQRFVRAMKTMLPVRQENLVALYGAGKTGQYCWMAMEYVDGESLTHVIHRIGSSGMLDWTYSFRIAMHIGRALEAAFEHQIIHRNVTPANILIRSSDKLAKLGDLMLAKALEGTQAEQITRTGQLVGDIVYMSPERTHGTSAADCRSDIYSLGATLYALLTGRPPFEGGTLPEAVHKIRNEAPVRPKKFQLGIPDYFEDAVMKMLAKEPNQRFQSPTELLGQLERIAKFQTRVVWEPGTGSAEASPSSPAPVQGAGGGRAAKADLVPSRASDPDREPEVLPTPTTHFFKNILAGLLDDDATPEAGPSGVEQLRQLVGKTLYNYEIRRVLARGKTSMIFYAEHPAKKLRVALKVLYPELARKEEETQRFIRSVKTMMPIHHPNIVQLYDAGRTDGHCWMAMEYVAGASLTRVIKEIGVNGMLDWRDALIVGNHIARGLQAAFEHHIVHRNIQPANILIRSSDNLAKLADLTLAKAFEGRLAEQITGSGELVGDMHYMSPERTHSRATIDQRSDIYSLGATLYALICGRTPVDGRTLPDLVGNIRKNPPMSPQHFQPTIPELFERVILKMLAKRPEDRHQTPDSLLADLERIATAEGIDM